MPYSGTPEEVAAKRRRYWQSAGGRAASRRAYAKNREAWIASVQERASTPEAKAAKREYDHARYLTRKEEVRLQDRAWKARNPDKVRDRIRRLNHRRRGAKPDAVALEYMRVLERDPCCYCGSPMEHVDHITAISVGGTGEWTNLTAACQRCNYSKHHLPLLHFLLRRTY